jgi:hypothetical protein
VANLKQIPRYMRENILWKTQALWRRKRKIIFPNQNKDTRRREIFRTLCNSYLESAERAVEKLLNYRFLRKLQ